MNAALSVTDLLLLVSVLFAVALVVLAITRTEDAAAI